jgi:hypothetical protein
MDQSMLPFVLSQVFWKAKKNGGRGWHHHQPRPRRRSIGAGEDRLREQRSGQKSVPPCSFSEAMN